MIVKVDSSTTALKNIDSGTYEIKGTGYLECRITFISNGSYKVVIKTLGENQTTITGKGISRINLDTDIFTIHVLETTDKLNIIVNNIKDYFFDILSLN